MRNISRSVLTTCILNKVQSSKFKVSPKGVWHTYIVTKNTSNRLMRSLSRLRFCGHQQDTREAHFSRYHWWVASWEQPLLDVHGRWFCCRQPKPYWQRYEVAIYTCTHMGGLKHLWIKWPTLLIRWNGWDRDISNPSSPQLWIESQMVLTCSAWLLTLRTYPSNVNVANQVMIAVKDCCVPTRFTISLFVTHVHGRCYFLFSAKAYGCPRCA